MELKRLSQLPTGSSNLIRRLLTAINQYVPISLSMDDLLEMETFVYRWYPVRIEAAIDMVMGKASEQSKQRAADMGWDYFRKPILDILSGDVTALMVGGERPNKVPIDAQSYLIVCNMLEVSMSRDELGTLLYEVPANHPQLAEACAICRERGNRNVHYMKGILNRFDAKAATLLREREEDKKASEPWTPPADYRAIAINQIENLQRRWEEVQQDIDLLRSLLDDQ